MKPFFERDFTLQKYEQLCRTFLESGYKVSTILDYLTNKSVFEEGYIVILRHDVDRKPFNALKMAHIETNLGIRSTYYFRAKTNTFKPILIKQIARLGHEIGYHYESLSDMHGNLELAIEDFKNNLQKFRKLVPVKTICMHGSPLSKWDNRDIWRKYDYKDFDLIGEPYLSIDYKNIIYCSDTGRNWDSHRFNLRDKVNYNLEIRIDSTIDLINLLKSKVYKTFFIQCHPERWTDHILSYLLSFFSDKLANAGKNIVKLARKRR